MNTSTNYSNGTFTTADGNQLFEQSWEVDTPKAAIAIVHGLGEHSARYAHVAAHFNQHGYAVFAYDQLGHGRSDGRKAYVDSIDIWRDDCAQFLERTRQRTAGLPLFVLAHSMGGLVFSYLAVTQLPKLDGVILSAPALVIGKDVSSALVHVAKLLSRVAPKLGAQKLDSKFVSRDTAEVQKYDNDPLVFHSAIPARTGAEMLRAMEIVRAGTPKISYPLLAVHGTGDQLVDVEATMQVYARAGSEDKTMRLFDEGYHESHNEPNRAEVLQLYTDWMDERVARHSAETESHHKKRSARKNTHAKNKQ